MQEFHLDSIGTHLRILLDESSPTGEDFSHITSRLQEFESKYSRFIVGNWMYNLNQDRRALLDWDARIMFEISLEIANSSQWYFDPTVGKRLTELGYGNQNAKHISQSESWKGNYQDIEICSDEVILHSNIELEFGWIGKWYMLDWVASSLAWHTRYLIDFGGDIYGRGWWQVGLENPNNLEEAIGILSLQDSFFACSSGSKRKWWNHHHLIDPHTWASAREVLATYIESSSGTLADGYATTLCVMPFSLACETLENTQGIEWIILSERGEFYQSRGSKCELFT